MNVSELVNKFAEYGEVTGINYPIVEVMGLPSVSIGEVLVFEESKQGVVMSIEHEIIKVLLSSRTGVQIGSQVARTGSKQELNMSQNLLGKTIDPSGKSLDSNKLQESDVNRVLDVKPASMNKRFTAKEQLFTGVSIVDTLIPIGVGQRELVVGDRKTGKSAFLLNVLKNHVLAGGGVGIYCAIGLSSGEIKIISSFLIDNNIAEKVVFIASSSSDPHNLIIMAPYSAITVAEYFRDKGESVLLILDDLSNHAKYYREVSLLSKAFPGRDSYPGDIFYLHARLLERAGSFEIEGDKVGSITCLPVAQTTQNDLTDYIVSNLISITDGHILFDVDDFSKGRRPAINIALSVTRLGRQTQTPLLQELNRKVSAFLTSNYEKSVQLSHFGSELSEKVQNDLEIGNGLYAFYNQDITEYIPISPMLVFATMSWLNLFHEDSKVKIAVYRKTLTSKYQNNKEVNQFVDNIVSVHNFQQLQIQVDKNKERLISICKKQEK